MMKFGLSIGRPFALRLFCQRFKATLSDKDMAILELRVEGYTFGEIADRLGSKTHSAVVKRMEAIKKRFIQYENETGR